MGPRITHMMTSRHILTDVANVSDRLATTQRKLASGKEITRPSDDPIGANRAISLRREQEGIREHRRNVDDAVAWQDATDVALGKIGDALQRARELVVQGSTGSAGPTARANVASEIDQIIEGIKQEASTQYAGRFVFSGTATETRPYEPGGADAYAGDRASIAREIGPGVTVPINTLAEDLLGNGRAAADGRLLDVLRGVAEHLRTPAATGQEALRTTDLVGIDRNLDELARMRAVVGASTNRLETAQSRLFELEESTSELLSETEDADMAKTMVDFSMQQAVYQSALKTSANIVQSSLLDFLR